MEVGGVIGACGNFDQNPPPPKVTPRALARVSPKEGGDIYFYLDQNHPPLRRRGVIWGEANQI